MSQTTANVRDDIAAYDEIRSELEASQLGRWVVFFDRDHVGTFDSFDEAAQFAVIKYGRGPYLIRQVGAPSVTMPASVAYGPFHAINFMRI